MDNVRANWKFLATVTAIFLGVALLGPLVFYGLPPLYAFMMESDSLVLLVAIPLLAIGWMVGSYWLLWRLGERSRSDKD